MQLALNFLPDSHSAITAAATLWAAQDDSLKCQSLKLTFVRIWHPCSLICQAHGFEAHITSTGCHVLNTMAIRNIQDLCDDLRMHAPARFPHAHLCAHQALSSCLNLNGNPDSQATCPRLTRKSGSRLNLSSNLENHRSSTLLGSTNVSPELPELNDSMYLHHGN